MPDQRQPFAPAGIDCPKCRTELRHRPNGGFLCRNRGCPDYEWYEQRVERQRRRLDTTTLRVFADGVELPQRPSRRRRSRGLKPAQVRIRYNDGSSYTLSNVMRVLSYESTSMLWIEQDPPLRATKRAPLQHWLPCHNVDAVTYRPALDTRAVIEPHSHDEPPQGWVEHLWAWLWGASATTHTHG